MTIVQTPDNRNLEWRKSNVGSKLLAKMGWTEGTGIGKRNLNSTALRAVKRQDGLGIGAKRQTEGGPSESTGNFASVLANLKAHHGTTNDKKKKKKQSSKKKAGKSKHSKKTLSLPSNKVVAGHARKMREAKFGAKSAQDLACIFGNTEVVATALGTVGGASAVAASNTTSNKKRLRSLEDSEKGKGTNEGSSSSEVEDATPTETKAKRAEKKAKKDKKSKTKDSKKSKKEKKSKKDKKKKSSKSD